MHKRFDNLNNKTKDMSPGLHLLYFARHGSPVPHFGLPVSRSWSPTYLPEKTWDSVIFYVLFCVLCVHSSLAIILKSSWEERTGCFASFAFLVSRDYCVALPHGAMGLSAVCDCGIF